MALSTALANVLSDVLRGRGAAEELISLFSASAGTSSPSAALVADANGNILINGQLYQSFADTITAQHTSPSQSTATKMTAMINRITTVTAAGDAVALPASVAGMEIQVINHGANAVQVYGNNAAGDKINDIATATGISQMAGSSVVYSCITAGNWYAEGIGTGYSGSYPTFSTVDNLTALAGGAQSGATLLTSSINRVVTVGSAGDSTVLPASAGGMDLTVINAHATNSIKVYAASGADVINALSNATAFSVAATKSCQFICATAGQWHTLLGN